MEDSVEKTEMKNMLRDGGAYVRYLLQLRRSLWNAERAGRMNRELLRAMKCLLVWGCFRVWGGLRLWKCLCRECRLKRWWQKREVFLRA